MTAASSDTPDADSYRVYLLRLWRESDGPWRASLQAADAASPHRFADMETLVAFLRELVPPVIPAQTTMAPGDLDTDEPSQASLASS